MAPRRQPFTKRPVGPNPGPGIGDGKNGPAVALQPPSSPIPDQPLDQGEIRNLAPWPQPGALNPRRRANKGKGGATQRNPN